MNVDIHIFQKSDVSKRIRIPVLPEKISVKFGDGKFVDYPIMGRGDVSAPTGVGLATISWQSEFPGAFRTDKSMLRGEWKPIATYHRWLERWKERGEELTLIVTGYPINMDVFVSEYTAEPSGAFGDLVYEVAFKECKTIGITSETVKDSNTNTNTATKRSTTSTKVYTIKSGDTLWDISRRYLGSGTYWKALYNANRVIIEKTAKSRGYSSSNNGWWIFPGTTITIP